jgi:hypothetical protein
LAAWMHPGGASTFNGHLAASLLYLHNVVYGAPSTALGVA